MITGHIGNIDKEGAAVPAILRKGLQYLAETDFANLALGRYEIDGNNMFALVARYRPQAKENCKAETHSKYIDIQYLAAGREFIGYAPCSDQHEILEDCTAEKDAVFYRTVYNESELVLAQGIYCILFPWDVHRPGCSSTFNGEVLKVVLKIRVDLLVNG